LAAMYPPAHDLAELLCFVLNPPVSPAEVDHYVEFHRRALEGACGRSIDAMQWRQGYWLSLRDLWVNRFAMYIMAHGFRHLGFLERSFRTLRMLLDLEEAAHRPLRDGAGRAGASRSALPFSPGSRSRLRCHGPDLRRTGAGPARP